MGGTHDLRLTMSACSDMGVSHEVVSASQLKDEHSLIAKFVDLRSQSVEGQEAIQLPRSKNIVWSLHAGRWRGLTWWDEDADVVWLLGAGFHESGSADDVYQVLKRRDEDGQLFPTEEDYLRLEPSDATSEDFVHALYEEGPRLVAAASESMGAEKRHVFAGILEVRVLADSNGVRIGFLLPPRKSGVLPPDYYAATLAALLPDAEPDELEHSVNNFPGSAHPGMEYDVLWRRPD